MILFNGKYLLVLRAAEENIDPSRWDIPGGGVEPGETARGTVIREVKEETGIDISDSKIIPVKDWKLNKDGAEFNGRDFLCILKNYQEVKLSPEHIRAKWLSDKEIMESNELPGWIKETLKLANVKIKEL